MPRIGEQADVLRALGWWLDSQAAIGVQITNYDTFLSVTWEPATPGERDGEGQPAYQEHHLGALRLQARRLRQGSAEGGSPGDSLAELLRTLGQELDQAGIELGGIVQEPAGFRVSGVAAGTYYHEFYEIATLLARSAERRASRGRGDEVTGGDRFTAAIQGLVVVSEDRQRLGRVAELHDDQLKVRAPFFQRDYWLPASTVAAVVPGEQVVLSLTKHELAQHKRRRVAQGPDRA